MRVIEGWDYRIDCLKDDVQLTVSLAEINKIRSNKHQ